MIGKKGLDIDKINKSVEKLSNCKVDVKIVEISKPENDASLVAQNIAKQLENRGSFKKAMKKSMQSTLKQGALGIKVSCSGRLSGAEIARTEWYKEGRVPLHTLRAMVTYDAAEAHTIYGLIGVKVWIYKGDKLVDNLKTNTVEKNDITSKENKV